MLIRNVGIINHWADSKPSNAKGSQAFGKRLQGMLYRKKPEIRILCGPA